MRKEDTYGQAAEELSKYAVVSDGTRNHIFYQKDEWPEITRKAVKKEGFIYDDTVPFIPIEDLDSDTVTQILSDDLRDIDKPDEARMLLIARNAIASNIHCPDDNICLTICEIYNKISADA